VVLDWNDDPTPGVRFAIYKLTGDGSEPTLLVGTTAERLFVHQGAAGAAESYFYRVTAIDACGSESTLD
jgi:hypothetical protein